MRKPAGAKSKKEAIFHPESRKAGQLVRKQLRKSKLSIAALKRSKKFSSQADVYGFLYHALPPDVKVLTLCEIHEIVRDLWLTRHDDELEAERASRRKGRPKSAKEMKLEETRLRELDLYRSGMEIPDLTHEANVELFRGWDLKEVAYIHLLRFIRISSSEPSMSIVSRPGKHFTLTASTASKIEPPQVSASMEVDGMEQPEKSKPLLPSFADASQFRSTIMAMDDGPFQWPSAQV